MGFNLKILAAPLMNRVHLVTIVLTAMLFGAFRLAGGELGMKSRGAQPERASAKTPAVGQATVRRPANIESGKGNLDSMLAKSPRLQFSDRPESVSGAESMGRAPTTVRAPSRLSEEALDLDQLVDVGSQAPARPAPSQPRNSGGLNDIERQLGLR